MNHNSKNYDRTNCVIYFFKIYFNMNQCKKLTAQLII